ncbi:hypothetical protein ACFL2Q_00625 [Thermodesulfobacteriota bacterium]
MARKTKTNEKGSTKSKLLKKNTEQELTNNPSSDMRDQELMDDFEEYRSYITNEINILMQRIRHAMFSIEDYGLSLKGQQGQRLVDISLMFSFRDQLVEVADQLSEKLDMIRLYDSYCRDCYDSTDGMADLMRKEIAQSLVESRSRLFGIPKLMTSEDVAEILGISDEEVNHLASEGRIGFVELTATKKAYTMGLVAEFIEGETYRRSWRWDQIKSECENFG